jgi:hypothetical protein
MEKDPTDSENQIFEINGNKFTREFVDNQLGLDGGRLPEKKYYSHDGPGWDYRFGYLEDVGKENLSELSDEPYIYRKLIDK